VKRKAKKKKKKRGRGRTSEVWQSWTHKVAKLSNVIVSDRLLKIIEGLNTKKTNYIEESTVVSP
jgi:hypothetical protein